MSELKEPRPAKLIIAFLYTQMEVFLETKILLSNRFGQIDGESPEFEFTHTRYYNEEMGENLKRRFVSFAEPVVRDYLPEIKLFTHSLENTLAPAGKRRINIDPGYLNLERVILASGKDAAHRIYLAQGVYAEVQLIFQSGSFQSLPWSYPDYKSEPVISWLNQIREAFKTEIKNKHSKP